MPETTHADVARLAARALRLRESGFDSDDKVRDLARLEVSARREAAEQQEARVSMQPADGHPLQTTALALLDATDGERPGPTDNKLVERLMTYKDLDSIWKRWDEAVTANLESYLPDADLKRWRDSVARDEEAFEERVALMTGASDAELIERAEEMLAKAEGLTDDQKARLRERLSTPPARTHEWRVHPYFGHMRHLDGAANAMFDLGREGFMDGTIIWTATPVHKVYLVDAADYAINLATHQFVSSIAVAGREETSPALTTKTKAAGVADADDTTFTAAAGDPCELLIIAMTSALGGGADVADTAQRLIGAIDTATGLPVTLNGGNVNVVWDSGSNRIFKL